MNHTIPLPFAPPADTGIPTLPAPAGWPSEPESAAYHGLAGEIVQTIAPHTEADPVAILAQLLAGFGGAVGRGAWFQVEATRHHPNEFVILVGDSAKARKGSSWDHVARVLTRADPSFPARIATGLSSGEGLIWSVRDPVGTDPTSASGEDRLLVLEPEFASVLKNASRDISTLSPVLRCAWDGRPLALLTRTAPAQAQNAHISVIGHITATELAHNTTTIEITNGFLNRFILFACRRMRLLPEGGHADPLKGSGAEKRLAANLKRARHTGQLRLDPHARKLWWEAYARLSEPIDGLAGALTARAEAHVIRLALIYALLDGQGEIESAHLQAALALWDYSAQSATWALRNSTGNPLAEQIHHALKSNPDGLTRTQLRDLFSRNRTGNDVEQALQTLTRTQRAHPERVSTGGRPAELWHATGPAPSRR